MEKDPLQVGSSPQIVAQPKKGNVGHNNGIRDMVDAFSYTHTLMYGKYATDLSEFAKYEAKNLKILEKQRKADDKRREKKELKDEQGRVWGMCTWVLHNTLSRFGEEWIFLALLGIIMAMVSFLMDVGVHILTTARIWLYRDIFNSSPLMQYSAWIFPAICLVLFSVGFTHLVAPQAAGSGIPEMKTILRGVVLKEYLTFKTMLAKVVGLTAALGSGIPIGKEGPFVHIASILATLLSKLKFHGIYANKSRYNDMLSVACAVGIGACFAAPVGGVLFSIEATTTYFAVRNCWRGFFAAVCGSSAFLLMAVWFQNAGTVRALFLTNFTSEFPFAPQELLIYAILGVICGFLGAGYVWLHHSYVTFIRTNKTINRFLQKNLFIYPAIIALIVSSISFPLGTGKYIGSELSTHDQLSELFSNFTWSREDVTPEQAHIISHWKTPNTSIFVNLISYVLFTYVFSVVCYTLPVPSGSFIPVFKIGAAIGRIFGELIHQFYPQGVWYGGILSSIIPGGYAVVAAAALASAVTHTCSEAVIIFEITGQVTHVVPVMIASLIANAVAELLQPSMYDSMILIKKLPYLPDILPSSSRIYSTLVDDFMKRDVKYIWPEISYQKLKETLNENKNIRSLPLVDSPANMILLGSVQRTELMKMIDRQIGREKRMAIAQTWHKVAEQRALEEQQQELDQQQQQQQVERRRSSRFEVIPAPDILSLNQIANNENPQIDVMNREKLLNNSFYDQSPKSILKKVNSMNLDPTEVAAAAASSDSRQDYQIQSALQDIESGNTSPVVDSVRDRQIPNIAGSFKKVQLPRDCIIDMSPEDKKQWEYEEMSKVINLGEHNVPIDPSPFQLVERTPIFKVHTLFNMMGINHAYVTNIGRLVGVVGLTDLRKAIENINSNSFLIATNPNDDEAKPLIEKSDKNVNTTITSMDSAFSAGSSEVGSEIEVNSKTPKLPPV